jgi:phage replication O-like protein O
VANVQVEKGFTRIANELYEALLRTPLPGRHQRVVLSIMRLTYGYGKTKDRIAASQVAALTQLDPRSVQTILADLRKRGLLSQTPAVGKPSVWRVVKDYDRWASPHTASAETHPECRRSGGASAETRGTASAHTHHQRKKETLPKKKTHLLRDAWCACREAAAGYGKQWRDLTPAREQIMAARLREHPGRGPEILVHAIHGYVKLLNRDGFDWRVHLAPETIYRASKFPKYLEAWEEKHDREKFEETLEHDGQAPLNPEQLEATTKHPSFASMGDVDANQS